MGQVVSSNETSEKKENIINIIQNVLYLYEDIIFQILCYVESQTSSNNSAFRSFFP